MEEAINLVKGQKINLTKEVAALKNVRARLTWKSNARVGEAFDADVSVFICDRVQDPDPSASPGDLIPKLLNNKNFVFWGNTTSPDGAVVHSGDDTTGGTGEEIAIDLSRLNPQAKELAFVVTIYDAKTRKQNFGLITNARIQLIDDATSKVILSYKLDEMFSVETTVQFGSLYLNDAGQWIFGALGTGYEMGIDEFVIGFGGTVQAP